VGVGEHPLKKIIRPLAKAFGFFKRRLSQGKDGNPSVAETYHGKVMPTHHAKELVMIKEDIRVRNLEQVIPFDVANDLILKNPDQIVALECPCRSSREHPCEPLDVCLIVGEPFASFVLEHHPRRSRRISGEEASAILDEELERGHVHHAFFKDAMLGRFYAICNCCLCCCGAMQASRNGSPMLIASGYLAQVDPALCIGCGVCEASCPFQAIELMHGISSVLYETCMGCGICAHECTEGAIQLVLDSTKGEPLLVKSLLEEPSDLV
jgi:ferredoxin